MGESARIGSILNYYYFSITLTLITLGFSLGIAFGALTLWTAEALVVLTLIQAIVVVVKTKRQRKKPVDPDMPTPGAVPGLITIFLIALLWLIPLAFNALWIAGGSIAIRDGVRNTESKILLGLLGAEEASIVLQILTLLTIFFKGIAERREAQRAKVNATREVNAPKA
ncbi:hypothetical protein FA15DRAFT_657648 [Coprinopsis marcescibilis]|uniref:Uncharacterized protein n=1 Tax=Coprinopsis marcescibilis TaxID=230819 RepID=A0A5C3KP57_COPMA|nr:hypothetical protein FA15DRAFT_657648 [Coprinopsis marcescibilis]